MQKDFITVTPIVETVLRLSLLLLPQIQGMQEIPPLLFPVVE